MRDNYYSSSTDLALILPCFNPENGWEKGIRNLHKYFLERLEISIAIVIVNDGSANALNRDSILQLNAEISQLFILENLRNRGKGASLRKGVGFIDARYYIYVDFDLPFLLQNIFDVYKELEAGFDVVTSRRGKEYWQKLPLQRKLLSKICSNMNKALLKLKFPDSQSGLKGFNRKGRETFLQTRIDRYLFDTEFVMLAEQHGDMKISAVDVQMQDSVYFSNMSIRKSLVELINYLGLLRKK